MSDISSARPVSGQPVASAWGGEVHDQLEGIQAGIGTIAISAAAFGSIAVVFPRAYAVPPIVVATLVVGSTAYYAVVGAITPTGFTLYAVQRDNTSSTTTQTASWIAIGTPA